MDFFYPSQNHKPEKGDLLISEPYLPDPNFERTVILLCAHDENGSFGLVLNKSSDINFKEAVKDIPALDKKLFYGGPVQQDTLHFVHRSSDHEISGQMVKEDIRWGGNFERIVTLINLKQIVEEDFKFFIGYSGWDADQLQQEIKSKSWIIHKNVTASMIFDTPPEDLWKLALNQLGGKYKMISKYPTDPKMN